MACGNIDIIVENHCQTDLTSPIRIGELCDKYGMYAYEEAVTPLNPDMQRELRAKVKTPLTTGERIYSRWGYMNFLAVRSQPSPCRYKQLYLTSKLTNIISEVRRRPLPFLENMIVSRRTEDMDPRSSRHRARDLGYWDKNGAYARNGEVSFPR